MPSETLEDVPEKERPEPAVADPIGEVILYSHPGLASAIANPTVAVVMGVSGSGKSTIAVLLAHTLGWSYQEGDDLHPPENVAKMAAGTPLTDEDRLPWLHKIAEVIDGWRAAGQSGVVTCSALKRAYRDIILTDRDEVRLVYMQGTKSVIHDRMARRHEHFMPVALLDSQFQTLEEPEPDEHPIVLSIEQPPGAIITALIRKLAELRPG